MRLSIHLWRNLNPHGECQFTSPSDHVIDALIFGSNSRHTQTKFVTHLSLTGSNKAKGGSKHLKSSSQKLCPEKHLHNLESMSHKMNCIVHELFCNLEPVAKNVILKQYVDFFEGFGWSFSYFSRASTMLCSGNPQWSFEEGAWFSCRTRNARISYQANWSGSSPLFVSLRTMERHGLV